MKLKKTILISLFITIVSLNLFSQNYRGVDLNLLQQVGDNLTKRYYANLNDYQNFVASVRNNFDPDLNGMKYKAQNNALSNFQNSFKSYFKEDNWLDAGPDLIQAKDKYYSDVSEYLSNVKYSSTNSTSPTTIEPQVPSCAKLIDYVKDKGIKKESISPFLCNLTQ